MANIIEVLSNYDGVARAKYIAAAGVSDFQLKSAMAAGAVSRVARGVVCFARCGRAADRHSLAAGGTCVHHRGAIQRAVGPRSPGPAACCPHPQQELPRLRLPPGRPRRRHSWTRSSNACAACPNLDGLIIAESAVVLKGLPLGSLRQRLDGRNDARERRIVSADRPAVAVASLSAWPGSCCGGPVSMLNRRSTFREWDTWTSWSMAVSASRLTGRDSTWTGQASRKTGGVGTSPRGVESRPWL